MRSLPLLLSFSSLGHALLLGLNPTGALRGLCSYDPFTGAAALRGAPLPPSLHPVDGVSTIDRARGIFYFAESSTSSIIGLSASNGTVLSSTPLPAFVVDDNFLGGLIISWAPDLGPRGLLAVVGDAADDTHLVGTLDVAGEGAWGAVANISSAGWSDDSLATGSYLPGRKEMVFDLKGLGGAYMTHFAVNLSSGGVRNASDPELAPSSILWNRAGNPLNASGSLFGVGALIHGSPSGPWDRTIDSLDPGSLSVGVVGVVAGPWGIEVGATVAVGAGVLPGGGTTGGESLFWFGTPSKVEPGDFFLLQHSLADASLVSVSAQPLCNAGDGFPPKCPYALHWVP